MEKKQQKIHKNGDKNNKKEIKAPLKRENL